MQTDKVAPTRSELQRIRAQTELAHKGRDLLQQKRNALMAELLNSADAVLAETEVLDESAAAARHALALGMALDGPEVLGSMGLAQSQQMTVQVSRSRVMGINILRIEPQALVRKSQDRPYQSTHASPRLDRVAAAFEAELEILLEVASRELRMRRLAEAIRQTTRQVNALEHILLPRLRAQLQHIELRIAEREREDVYRLRRIKSRLRERHQDQGS